MKKNQLADIKKLDIKALKQMEDSFKKELIDLTIAKTTGKLSNLRSAKNKRRDLAQVLTVLKQKDLISKLEGEANGK